jgi:hypothetical protein
LISLEPRRARMKLGAREKTVLAGVIVFVLGGLGLDL